MTVDFYKIKHKLKDDEYYSKRDIASETGIIDRRLSKFLKGINCITNQSKNVFLYRGSDVNKRIDELVEEKRAIVFDD